MLKGVNKQVIEVTDTGNQYIKKAILFIDPDKAAYDSDFLIHQAKKYLKQTEQGKQPVPFKKDAEKWDGSFSTPVRQPQPEQDLSCFSSDKIPVGSFSYKTKNTPFPKSTVCFS